MILGIAIGIFIAVCIYGAYRMGEESHKVNRFAKRLDEEEETLNQGAVNGDIHH